MTNQSVHASSKEEMLLKSLEFLTISLVVFGRELPKEPNTGFRFNCWSDLCKFPIQFCDLDERRCQYCSDDLCKGKDYPEQCQSYCTSLLPTTTPNVSTTTISSPESDPFGESSSKECNFVQWMIFGAVCLIILVLSLLLILTCLNFKKRRSRRQDSLTKNGQHLRHPESCHSYKHDASKRTIGIQDSPTGQSGPHENQGNHRLLDINNSKSSIDSNGTTPTSHDPDLPLQPTVSGHNGPAHKAFECNLLENTNGHQTATDEQYSNGSSDSGYRDNSAPLNGNTNMKTIDGGASPENCPLLRQCTQGPTEETTYKTSFF